jgi:hypothetical protein
VALGGVVRGLVGGAAVLVLGVGAPGAALAAPVVTVGCDASVEVTPGTTVALSALGATLATKVFTDSGSLSGVSDALRGAVCTAIVRVVAPVVSAVPPAPTGPAPSAVAPVAPPAPVPGGGAPGGGVPGGGAPLPVLAGSNPPSAGVSPPPPAAPAPAPGAGGGSGGGGNPVGETRAPGADPVPTAPGVVPSGVGPSATGPVGSGPAASGPSSTGPASSGTPAAGTSGQATSATLRALGLLSPSGSRPPVFGDPTLLGFTVDGAVGPGGVLAGVATGRAAGSSVQALNSPLGTRPGLVVLVAVLALAATAGCTVRQWVLRAVPSLTPVPVVAVTRGAHRR